MEGHRILMFQQCGSDCNDENREGGTPLQQVTQADAQLLENHACSRKTICFLWTYHLNQNEPKGKQRPELLAKMSIGLQKTWPVMSTENSPLVARSKCLVFEHVNLRDESLILAVSGACMQKECCWRHQFCHWLMKRAVSAHLEKPDEWSI